MPAGVGLAVGLLAPFPVWPGVAIGAFFTTLLDGGGLLFALATGVANGLEVGAAVWMLGRVGFIADLRSTRGMVYLAIFAAGVAAAVAAGINAAALALTGGIPGGQFGRMWVMWWLTHAIGMLVVVPTSIGLVRNRPAEPGAASRMLTILVAVLVSTWIPFAADPDSLVGQLFFVPLVLLLFAALRNELLSAALGALIITVGAVLSAVFQTGPLVGATPNETLFLTWSFTSVTTVTVLAAAAVAYDRAHVARERARLQDQVLHAQKLEGLGVLAGGVAHDFNNLLMGITGYADLLRDNADLDAQSRADVDGIILTAEHASELCGQMLTYAGKTPPALAPLDVASCAADIHRLLSVSVSKSVELRLEAPRPVFAMADDGQIRQVVLNLATNAAEAVAAANRPGIVKIRVEESECDEEWLSNAFAGDDVEPGTFALISVRDDGVGLEAEQVSRIFDPFFTTKGPGRGLGLSATLGVIRAHRGAIAVETGPARGSIFRVALPLADAEAVAEEPAVGAGLEGDARLVLVVDDEDQVREVVSRMLEAAGYRTIVAADGRDALARLEAHPDIGLVLLDLTMSGLDGIATIREMRDRGIETPVVVASGYAREAVPEDVVVAGFIHKPFRRERLLETLRAAWAAEEP